MARTNPQGNITTIYIKTGNDIWDLLNGNKDENLIGVLERDEKGM